MEIIDARGMECPGPVVETKKVVDRGISELSVWTDNETAALNVSRFLEGQGYAVKREDGDNTILLEGKKIKSAGEKKSSGRYAVLITSDKIGADSNGLGDALMKAFLGTLLQREYPPVAIGLMNDGVKMALAESSARDTLAELEERGTQIFVCGTCAKHFDITGKISVGLISNMFEITEAVFGVSKPIVIG